MAEAPRLKPQTVTEILDSSFRLYRENFATFLGILAIVYIPGIILQMLLTGTIGEEMIALRQQAHTADGHVEPAVMQKLTMVGMGQSLVILLITGLTFPLATGTLTRAVSSRYLNERISIGACFSYVLSIFLKYMGTILLSGLVMGIGWMFCIVPGILFAIWFSFTSSVVVLEGLGGTTAMGRSKQLSKDNAGRIIGLWLITFILTLAVNYGVGFGFAFILPKVLHSPVHLLVATQGLQQVIGMILSPLFSVAWILLYYDIRIRKEAFDLEVLAKSMGSPQGAPPAPPAAPALPT